MISVRASNIPILLLCPSSHADGFMRIDSDNEAARLGDASHDGAALYVREGKYADAEALADLHHLSDADELERMLAYARNAWDGLKASFPSPMTEIQMAIMLTDEIELTGREDVMQLLDEHVVVADWKSGYRIKNFFDQLRAYALLGCTIHNKPKWSVTIIWLRDAVKDTRSGTAESLQSFKLDIIAAVNSRNDEKYRVGSHCDFCPRFHDCPARRALVKQSTSDICGIEGAEIRELAKRPSRDGKSNSLSEVMAGLRCIEKACEDFRSQLKSEIESGGAIATVDGASFEFAVVNKRVLHPIKSWPAISSRLDENEIALATKLSLSKLSQAVSDRTAKGQKKAAIAQMVDELEAAGAITIKPEKRLKEVPPKQA